MASHRSQRHTCAEYSKTVRLAICSTIVDLMNRGYTQSAAGETHGLTKDQTSRWMAKYYKAQGTGSKEERQQTALKLYDDGHPIETAATKAMIPVNTLCELLRSRGPKPRHFAFS